MRKFLKWLGIGLGGLVVLALVAATVTAFLGSRSLKKRVGPPRVAAALASPPADSDAVARGAHIVQTRMCGECHGDDLGGKVFLDIPPGLFPAPNLTAGRGGLGAGRTAAQWDAAFRWGMKHDSTALLPFMPYILYNRLSDGDAAAVAAYLAQLPPVDRELPARQVRIPGLLMAAMMDIHGLRDSLTGPAAEVPRGPTAAYGAYLASTTCVECHGEDLTGGFHPSGEGPPAPGLAFAGTWPLDGFVRAMRTGVTPNGRTLAPTMPVKYLGHFDDVEMQALHEYLKTVPKAPPPAPPAD